MNDSCIILQTYNFIDKLICVMNIFMFFYSLSKAAAPCVLPSGAEPLTPVFPGNVTPGLLACLEGSAWPLWELREVWAVRYSQIPELWERQLISQGHS